MPSLENNTIIVQDIARCAPSLPSDLITIAFLAAKQLSFKENTGDLSRNPMTWWLRHSLNLNKGRFSTSWPQRLSKISLSLDEVSSLQTADTARVRAVLSWHTLGPSLGALGWSVWWQRLHWSSSWDIPTWFHHSSFCWSCLRTTENHLQKFLENFPQPFSFLGQCKGKSTLSDLQEERQRKRLKEEMEEEMESPPLNCRNGEGILHSPLPCFCAGSLVISAGGICALGKQAVVARDTMISSEGSQLPSPAQCHSCCRAWGASAHACKITLFNFLFL